MKQRKELSPRLLLVLIVVGALLVGAAAYVLVLKPQRATLADLQTQIAARQQTLEDFRAAAAGQTGAPKIRVADVYRLSRAMPSTVDMPDVLLELDDVARSSGIQLDDISPGAPSPGNGFQVVPIHLTFAGSFYAVTDMLYRLRNLVAVRHGQLEAGGRLFAVQSATLTPTAGGRLGADVMVDTYVYGVPGAAPVPGASTTTTTTTAPPPSSAQASAAGAQGGSN